jgi:hypothetical protein
LDDSADASTVEDHLLKVLQMVNDWLRFAETKNAGLLGITGLAITALLAFATQSDHFNSWASALLSLGSLLWLVSLVSSALSFVPKTDQYNILDRLSGSPADSDNLYYYGHLSKYNTESLLRAIGGDAAGSGPRARFEKNLAQQIITNSRITGAKLKYFQIATVFWVIGLTPITIGVVVAFSTRS